VSLKRMIATDTQTRILQTARRMVQARGCNALSFREIAREVRIAPRPDGMRWRSSPPSKARNSSRGAVVT